MYAYIHKHARTHATYDDRGEGVPVLFPETNILYVQSHVVPVCTYVFVYVYIYACMKQACMYKAMPYLYICVCICIYTDMHICCVFCFSPKQTSCIYKAMSYLHVCMYVCMYNYTCYIHHIHTCIHTYIHTYKHTYMTHTHAYSFIDSSAFHNAYIHTHTHTYIPIHRFLTIP
jgi:hypothetical protein